MRPNGDNDFSQRAPLALHARGPHHDPSANTTQNKYDHAHIHVEHRPERRHPRPSPALQPSTAHACSTSALSDLTTTTSSRNTDASTTAGAYDGTNARAPVS